MNPKTKNPPAFVAGSATLGTRTGKGLVRTRDLQRRDANRPPPPAKTEAEREPELPAAPPGPTVVAVREGWDEHVERESEKAMGGIAGVSPEATARFAREVSRRGGSR